MKTFTKGPWTTAVYRVSEAMVKRLTVGSLHHAVCVDDDPKNPEGLLVAICGDEPGADSQSAADARLIAGAPELFEQLRRTTAALKDAHFHNPDRIEGAEAYILANEALLERIEKGGK